MSYTVLARRYRSSTFDDLVGQEHIARTLKRAIESGRIAHAFLFCGTRGTGKTSTARILAKCLNCESSDKATAVPCSKCESCKGIARGDDIDVIEIDAASNRGIDEVRKIIENARFSPARARFKVYIIDEVHAMTKDAFNALLKVLEEPPAHVKFILATTEPEKVLSTILSRCQRYDFRNIPTREIAGHLSEICKTEKVQIDEDAVLLVAKAGAGSMRDSLSLLDRLLSLGETHVTAEMIENLLGLPKTQLLFDLADALGRGEVGAAIGQADAIITGGLSPDSLIAALVEHLRNLLILATCGKESHLVEVPGLPIDDLVTQAKQFDAIALSQDIAILEELRRTMRTSQAGRALLDATLVRIALAEQFASIDGLLNGDTASVQKKKPESVVAPGAPVPTSTARENVRASLVATTPASPISVAMPSARGDTGVAATEEQSSDEPPVDLANIDLGDDDALPSVGRVWDGPSPSLGAIMAGQRNTPVSTIGPATSDFANVEPVGSAELSTQWQSLLGILDEHAQGLYGIVSQGNLTRIIDNIAIVRFPSGKDFLLKLLDRNGKREAVASALSQVLRRDTGVRFEVSTDANVAPTARSQPNSAPAARPAPVPDRGPAKFTAPQPPPMPESPTVRLTQEMKDTVIANEPLVKAIIDQLGGDIVKIEEN